MLVAAALAVAVGVVAAAPASAAWGFTGYVSTHTNNPSLDGYPKTIQNATNCFGADQRYFVHIEAIDRVGIGKKIEDSLCIVVKLFPGRQHPDPLIKNCGAPEDGDVVINQ